MFVKIAKLGAPVNEVVANPGQSIQSVLDENGVAYNRTDGIALNGVPATLQTGVRLPADKAYATVAITPQVKGGVQFFVKVGNSGGTVTEVLVESGWSVKRAIEGAGLDPNGKSVTVNGVASALDRVLSGNETLILLTAPVKGGK